MIFQPTYLYIKQHTITWKLYFGKTTSVDPIKYHGSGLHWGPHIKVHGREHVVTLWYCLFTDQAECTKFALEFSEKMDIVKSDQWLNLIIEDGLGSRGKKGIKRSAETCAKMRARSPRASSLNHISKNSEHVKKMRAASIISPNHVSKCQVKCPYCSKEGLKMIMKRWHFNNCKLKELSNGRLTENFI